jgi:hypothetical protein
MSEIVDINGVPMTEAQVDGISQFWNEYQEQGIGVALATVRDRSETGADYRELELAVPHLIGEARNRGIDVLKFLQELDAEMAKREEEEDASGTDDGVSELSANSSDEADQPQNEDESASASDVDGESWEE